MIPPTLINVRNVEVEFAHLRRGRIEYERGGRTTTVDKRAQLQCPPFATDKRTWERAVGRFIKGREKGAFRGTPFVVVTQIYRQMGGDFR